MPKFDVSVVGAGLGGLAAAALLSKKKKKTIVIEQSESLNSALGVLEKDGFNYFAVPNMSYGFQRGGSIHELSASLGIVQEVSVLSPCYQVALPDHRVTVYAEQNETLEELSREFPKEIDALTKFYRELHKAAAQNSKNRVSAYLSGHRSAAKFIRKYRFSRELMAFFEVQSMHFFQKSFLNLSLESLITLCDSPPLQLSGGFKHFADQLYGIILQHGGEVHYRELSAELVLKDGHVIGIKTMQGLIEAGNVLLDDIQQEGAMLFMGLCDEVVPVGMSREVLFVPHYEFPRDFIALSLSVKDDAGSAPLGMRALTASFHSEQPVHAEKRQLIERIGSIIPFLSDYLVFAEEIRGRKKNGILSGDITFKALRNGEGTTLLHKGSSKNVYLLEDELRAPLRVLSTVQRFAEKIT